MIDEIILSPQLLANINNLPDTSDFIVSVIAEYLKEGTAPLQKGSIDSKRVQRRLERMLEAAIKQKNPNFELGITVNLHWHIRDLSGFSCSLQLGVQDFDLSPYTHNVNKFAPVWH